MPGSADLVVRVLADTGNAQGNINSLIQTLGKVAGVGAGATVAGGFVEASMKVQDAMAKVQTAYNSVDFTPGTQRFTNAQDSIQRFSETTATSFADAADVYAQGARFINEAGQRLNPTQLDAYTDSVLRLSKVSSDGLSPVAIGQSVDILSKLFGTSDFNKTGSEISALSGMHNQGEGPGLDSAIAIGQVGADIGVSQEQSLAVGNFLADLGLGGQMGGSAVGRMLQRTNTAVDTALDPEQLFSDQKKQRDAGERLSDLQDQLAVAQQRHSQMFGQHGLKKAFKRDPAAMMASDNEMAKLQREIADQKTDMSHMGDSKSSASSANIGAMASLLGEDKDTFAQSFQSDPMGALLQWTNALSKLPQTDRMSAMTKAFGGRGGVLNVRDQKIIEALANPDRQGSLQSYLEAADDQAANPTDLATRSAIPLSTTSAKVTDVANAAFGTAAAAGNGPREAIDGLAQKVLDNTDKLDQLNKTLGGNPLLGTIATGVVSGLTAIIPSIITGVLTGKVAGGAAVKVVSGAASTAAGNGAIATAAGGGGFLDLAAPALAVATPFILAKMFKDQHPDSAFVQVDSAGQSFAQHHPIGAVPSSDQPQQVNVGGVTVNVPGTGATGWDAVKDSVIKEMEMAWNAAVSSQPVSNALGGNLNVSGQGPR